VTLFGDRKTFAFELRPLAKPPPEADHSAAATWAELQIWVGGRNVTRHVHEDRSPQLCEGLHWPVIYLARWLARSWPRLFEQQVWPIPGSYRNARDVCRALDTHLLQLEEGADRGTVNDDEIDRFAEERDDFVRSHALAAGAAGGLCPDMYFARDGARLSIALRSAAAPPDVQFLYRPHQRDIEAPLFVDAARGLIGWAHEQIRTIDAPVCVEDRELFSAWLSRVESPAAAEASLFGYMGIAATKLGGMFHSALDRLLPAPGKEVARLLELTQLFELEDSWWKEGASFDPSRSGVAMVFRALAPTLMPRDILGIVQTLRSYPRIDRADGALLAMRGKLPPRTGRQRDFDHGYALAAAFREQLGNVTGGLDVEAWLQETGICIEELPIADPDVDGGAVWDDAHGPVILVNPGSPRAKTRWGRRMVLAHELCHLLIDRDAAIPLKIMSSAWAPPLLERRANAFAAELLLPRAGIVDQIGIPSAMPDDATVEHLMDMFEVGKTVCVEHIQNRFQLDTWGQAYRPQAPVRPARPAPPKGIKEMLLAMPDVGEDADFERPLDHGRPDEPWDS
jgi:Zn-dependent peptidase ImmA (M78 family)